MKATLGRATAALFLGGIALALAAGHLRHRAGQGSPRPRRPAPPPLVMEEAAAQGGLVVQEVVLLGTRFRLAVESGGEPAAAALAEVLERLRRLDGEISAWRQGSQIQRLNASAGLAPVQLGEDAYRLLSLSRRYCEETEGAFDVTVGPLWDLWPFRDPSGPVPAEAELARARGLVGCQLLQLDPAARTGYLPRKGMSVNLDAISKGYAALLAGEVLRRRGVSVASIEAGGDRYLLRPRSRGPWQVEIPHPRWPERVIERITAANAAVFTSGGRRRALVRGGQVYSHILDPRTGRPARGVQSVTVLTEDPAAADAYATAVFVLGPERGLRWVEARPHVQALLVDDNTEVLRSSSWARVTGRPEEPDGAAAGSSGRRARGADTVVRAGRLTPTEPGQRAVRDFSAPEPEDRSTPPIPASPASPLGAPARPVAGPMVAVPAGDFTDADGRRGRTAAFRIDRTEVRNRAYATFLLRSKGDPHRYCHPQEPPGKDHTPRYWTDDWQPALLRRLPAGALQPFDLRTFRDPDGPVVGVDWWDAYAYTRWAARRLPTRAEWSKAAGGAKGRRWPWGDRWDRRRANLGGEMNGERDGHSYHARVDAFPAGASPYGCLNMAGNVAEWVEEGLVMGGSSRSTASAASTSAGERKTSDYRGFDVGIRAAAGAAAGGRP